MIDCQTFAYREIWENKIMIYSELIEKSRKISKFSKKLNFKFKFAYNYITKYFLTNLKVNIFS